MEGYGGLDGPSRCHFFNQSLLQMEFPKEKLLLDLGWYPEGELEGTYRVDTDWFNPIVSFESKSKEEIVEKIELDLTTEPGVSIEIREYFKEEIKSSIRSYEYCTINNIHKIKVKLNDFLLSDSHEIFMSFMEFISYSHFAVFHRIEKDDSIEYYLLSTLNDEKGFLCHVIFTR